MAQGIDINVKLGTHILERGDVMKGDVVTGRLYGKSGAPLIVIPGGISATRFIADGQGVGQNWWTELVAHGGAIDLDHYQVLGVDLAPCGENTQSRLTITTQDQAKRLTHLLDYLEASLVHTIIGTSYGGMVAMMFAQNFPERLGKLCLLGAAHRPFPMGVAIRGIQRRIIEFGIKTGNPSEGLKLARELAMTTYRSPEEFLQRFNVAPLETSPICFDAGEYLEACGRKYPDIMPVNRFLALSESIDLHSAEPAKIQAETLLISTRSDQLAPPSEIELLRDGLVGPAHMVVLDSLYGHDSFLKDTGLLAPLLANFIKEKRCAA
ncbi:MAG: homoserine O-succinyltransferase [Robiginitomaculum sp.]